MRMFVKRASQQILVFPMNYRTDVESSTYDDLWHVFIASSSGNLHIGLECRELLKTLPPTWFPTKKWLNQPLSCAVLYICFPSPPSSPASFVCTRQSPMIKASHPELLTFSLNLTCCPIPSKLTMLPPSLSSGPQPSFRAAESSFLHVHHCILMSFSSAVLKFSLALAPSQRSARLDKLNYENFVPAILPQLNLLFYHWINTSFSSYSACILSSPPWPNPFIGTPASKSIPLESFNAHLLLCKIMGCRKGNGFRSCV